jgi:plastocyanin
MWLLSTDRPAAAQAQDGSGRIEGVAFLAPRLTSQHQRVRIYSEPGARETAPGPAESPLENVVVYLEAAPRGAGGSGGSEPAMRQRDERFVPHVLPIVAGTAVAFPNDDPIYHNVFSLSRAKSFDLGRFARGESRTIVFPRAGLVQVFCHIHADMSAYILVLDNRFFAKPDSSGHFAIDGIPPGEYRLVAWHERIHPISQPVRVVAGQTTAVRLSIPLSESPDSS